MLTCECDYGPEPGQVLWWVPNDYNALKTKQARKCQSCGCRIQPGDIVVPFDRYKVPETDVELCIYGEEGEIPRATHYHCEACGDQFFNLAALGFCMDIYENMPAMLAEYVREYGS